MDSKKNNNNTICIAGISGFIGKAVSKFLIANNYIIKPIGRSDIAKGSEHIANILDGCNAVINLVGAPIQKKWTKDYKEEIYYSRVNTTRLIVEAIHKTNNKPSILISSSAIGIYNSMDIHDEFSDKFSDSFLGTVCRDWENEVYSLANDGNTRLIIFRFGIVLSDKGGAFSRISLPFKFFAGSKIGDGYQWFPYIHIDDVLSAFWFVLANKNARGVYNLVVPNIITYDRFCKVLSRLSNRPYWLRVPNFILKMLYGEGTQVLITGQHVKPHRLIREGFYFQYPTTIKTIKKLLNKK